MRVFTDANVDPHGVGVWAVVGPCEMYGTVREMTLFTGNVFACMQFAAR